MTESLAEITRIISTFAASFYRRDARAVEWGGLENR